MPNTTVTLIGNVTKDPELRFTNSNIPVCAFAVAVNEGKDDAKVTSFYDVTAWRSLGENVATTLRRGMRVVVVGSLVQRSWETDGQKRSKIEVTAEAVGPDLRFAVATVQAQSAPGANEAPAGRSAGYGGGEEPF